MATRYEPTDVFDPAPDLAHCAADVYDPSPSRSRQCSRKRKPDSEWCWQHRPWQRILGKWPGDETDEEIQKALDEIS